MKKLSRFRLFSANVWNGEADPKALANLLLEEEIDVAVFQEITPRQAEAVASVLPHGEIFPDDDHHGMGIATRSAVQKEQLRLGLPADAWPTLGLLKAL